MRAYLKNWRVKFGEMLSIHQIRQSLALQNLGLYGNNETNDEMVLSAVDQVLNNFNVQLQHNR